MEDIEMHICNEDWALTQIATNLTNRHPLAHTSPLNTIELSDEDKQCMYHIWRFSLIIKLLGKRISHQYLKAKIQQL